MVNSDTGERVGSPHSTRKEALDHLRALYSNVPDAKASGEMMKANLMEGAIHFEADADNPRLLHFRDYVLARPETNKNRDNVDARGIQELAETIPLMPIDYNHDSRKNVGTFTAGRVGSDGELRVDGVIWLDRCEENGVDPDDVIRGSVMMSIEADGASAECSICHGAYTHESEYCEHIRVQGNDGGLRSKLRSGAVRIMRGLRALGGAFTYKPAGSGTGQDVSSRVVFAAGQLEVEMSDNELTASEIAELWVNEMSAISRREDVSDADKERAEKEYGDVEYADEKNKRYPIDEKHVRAAWSYINMPKNAEKYSAEDLERIKNRIKRAAKKFGIEIAEDKKNEEKASMNEDEKKEAPEEEKKETPEVEKQEGCADMKAEYEAMKASLADMTTKLEAAQKELEQKAEQETRLQAVEAQLSEANAQLADAKNTIAAHEKSIREYRVNELRAKLVGSVMDEDEFTAKQDTLLGLPVDAIELMTRNTKKEEKPTGRMNMAASDRQEDSQWALC